MPRAQQLYSSRLLSGSTGEGTTPASTANQGVPPFRMAKRLRPPDSVNLSSSSARPYDVTIIGGGIVGLATARELLLRRSHKNTNSQANTALGSLQRICVVEKEDQIAMHQSKRNSGVLHAGIYYAPLSKRAQFCVKGMRRMYRYCAERGLPAYKIGKLIVAVEQSELEPLEALFRRGQQNGVRGLRMIDREEILQREPYLEGAIRGIHSPETGIADFQQIAYSYAREACGMGAELVTGFNAVQFSRDVLSKVTTVVAADGRELHTRHIISCAGLYADKVATKTGGNKQPTVVPFRGEWLVMKPQYRHAVKELIYPVPNPKFPWLGIHFTPKVDGNVWIGPNAVLATAREGYTITDWSLMDLKDLGTHKGLPKLIKRYWKTGTMEAYRSIHRTMYVRQLQRYIPEIGMDWLEKDKASGVRALALNDDGSLENDFRFDESKEWKALHVRNAPSPAATSSLLIAEEIVNKVSCYIE